ncbi:MAG: triple tyrosine motif-containing protein [Lacibacter sp.]
MLRFPVLLFAAFFLFAETESQQLYFNHLSVNNGLSQGVNNCVYRDSRGYIWISSFDGLNRFDGIGCTVFRSAMNDTNGLRGTLFLNILEDKESNLWIGSNESLNYYNRKLNRFSSFRMTDRKADEQFYSPFYIDDEKKVWLQSRSEIFIFNPADRSFKKISSNFSGGNLLVKTYPQQLYQKLSKLVVVNNNFPLLFTGNIDNTQISWIKTVLPLQAARITGILLSGKDSLWLGTDNGFYSFLLNDLQKAPVEKKAFKGLSISALHREANGTFWIGTLQDGLMKADVSGEQIINRYSSSPYNTYSLSGNHVQYIYTDAGSNLWVSTWGKGIDYSSLHKFRFNHYLTKEEAVASSADNFIKSVIKTNHEIWCGTQSGGILILDENKRIVQSLKNNLPPSIEYLCEGLDKKIWIATVNGIYTANTTSKQITKLNLPLQEAAARQFNFISQLSNGNMLLSSNAGLYLAAKDKNSYSIAPAKGVDMNEVYLTTFTDGSGNVYLSKAFKGFSVTKLQGDSFITVKEFPVNSTIKCFTETNDSITWIGSTIGLIRFNKKNLSIEKIFTTADGLSNQYIYGAVPDGDYLWLSTNSGINRLNTKDYTVKKFSAGDGLQSNEYNTYSYFKTENNEIMFGGVNGLNAFYPSEYKNFTVAPQLLLTDLQLNDTTYISPLNCTELNALSLSYKQNTVSFRFTVIDYANASGNSISYMLDGYDKGWVSAPNKTFIRYANLPPGNYTLNVKAFNADGIMAKEIYHFSLHIQTPWWQSWWFRTLIILSLLSLVYYFVSNYINRRLDKQRAELEKQQAVEKERNRISRDMHDDLGSGLTKIAILSEVAKQRLSQPEKAKEQIDKIAVSSRELVDNLQDIIWVLNPNNDSLESLSAYIREYGLKYFEALSVQMHFDYPAEFPVFHLGKEQRRNIFLTVKECFQNIAKHAWCNNVFVSISEQQGGINISIRDDGKGFDEKSVRLFANGIKNMQNRVEHSNGTFTISSIPGKGTECKIRIHT